MLDDVAPLAGDGVAHGEGGDERALGVDGAAEGGEEGGAEGEEGAEGGDEGCCAGGVV